MNKAQHLMAVASWEDRFEDGVKQSLVSRVVEAVTVFYSREYSSWTHSRRAAVARACQDKDIPFRQIEFSMTAPSDAWFILRDSTLALSGASNVLLDISTMPRDILWSLLLLLTQRQVGVEYLYYKPDTYNKEWLSRDPQRPRLIYKLSGEMQLGRSTALIITTGYDVERTRQLIRFYEPKAVFLGIQVGEQFGNQIQNAGSHKEGLSEEYQEFNVQEFPIDAYSPAHGANEVLSIAQECVKTHNVVMSSLGPKLTAIALFNVCQRSPECALTYAPSGEFNERYSLGTSSCISGTI